MAFLPTNASQVQQFAVALYGIKVGTTTMAAVQNDITQVGGLNNALNAYYSVSFGSVPTADVAASIAANLGLTAATGLADVTAYITAQLNAAPAGARGQVVSGILNLFSTLSSNAVIGTAVTAWNTKVASAVSYTGTTDATVAAGSVAEGQSFTLTTDIDTVSGTAYDDTIVADGASVSAADQVNGGAGNDTLKIYSATTTILPDLSNVESVYIKDSNGIDDLDVSAVSALTSLEIASAATSASTETVITVAAGQALKLTKVTDGDSGGETANDSGEFEIASASTVTSLSITLSDVGDSGTGDELEIDVNGAGVTALSISSIGDKNYAALLNEGAKLETITVTGDKLLSAAGSAITTIKSIDASASTGGVKLNVTGSTLDVAIKGGAGDDSFVIGADLDTYDVIDAGAGTDTVVISDATLTSSTLAAVKGANKLNSVEVLGVSAASTITIDASIFTAINNFTNAAAVTGTSGAGASAAPSDAVNFTFQTGDSYIVGANLTGAAGSGEEAGSTGADALEVAAKVNSGTDTITITFAKGSATTLTGGAGVAGSAGALGGEGGGDAINAETVEVINIVTASKDDDVTLTAGASGSANNSDDTAASISVGANATINLSGAGDVNLGTVVTQGTSVDDLTINGSAMTGILTVTTGAGNDIISGGSKADVITAGTGINSITGGAGADNFKFADDSSEATALTTITDFVMGAGNDVITFTTTAGVFEKIATAAQDAINSDTTLADAVAEAGAQLGDHEATAFVWGGNAYVVYDEDAGDFIVIKLSGITDVTAFDATNIA